MLALALGCGRCLGDGPLRVGGDAPYVRCLAADPAGPASGRVGAIAWRIQKRQVVFTGIGRPWTLAAFSGPGLGAAPGPDLLAALRAAKPDLLLMLGDAGDTPVAARATLAALALYPAPIVVIGGGRDTRARLADAIKASHGHALDATGLREIRIASDTLVPVAGAAEGSYALSGDCCGFGLDDVKRVAGDLGDARGQRRWLVAWYAPATAGAFGVGRAGPSLDLGSPILRELGRRIDAPGGIFAFPHEQALRPSAGQGARALGLDAAAPDLQLVVPRISGVAVERSDGSRVPPGFALLGFDDEGMRLREVRAQP